MIVVPFLMMMGALALAFLAGVFPEDDGAGYLFFVPAVVMVISSLALSGQEVNERWSDWSVCEDSVTEIDNIIVADCDEYYKYPGEPDE